MTELETLLQASIDIAKLKRECGLLRLKVDMLLDENASLRRCVENDFEISADAEPRSMFHIRQAE